MTESATKEVSTEEMKKELPRPTGDQLKIVEKLWEERAASMGYKKGTKKYDHMEVEFFVGAMAMIQTIYGEQATPAKWYLMLMSGRNIV